MKFFSIKDNKMYNSFYGLPILQNNNHREYQMSKSNLYDQSYDFFFKGRKILAQQAKQLSLNSSDQQLIVIINIKQQTKPKLIKNISYDSHRQVIQRYTKNTKENNIEKIKQNAQFIFENAIDGNFKYHTFEYFELEHEFTEQRKKQLLQKIFPEICKDKCNDVKMVEREKKENKNNQTNNSEKKQQQYNKNNKDNKNRIQQKQPYQQQQRQRYKQQYKIKQKGNQQSQNPSQIEENIVDKKQQNLLQLHELEYINDNWKQLICVNKYLLKTNLDNPLYYQQFQKEMALKLVEKKKESIKN